MNNKNETIYLKTNLFWNLKLFLNKRFKKFIIIWRLFSITSLYFFLYKINITKEFIQSLLKTKIKNNLASSVSVSSIFIFLFSLIFYVWLKITEIIPNFVRSINLNSSQFESIFRGKFFLINGKKFNVVKFESITFFVRDGSNLINVRGKVFSILEDGNFEFYFNSDLHSNSLPYFFEEVSKDKFFHDLNVKLKRSNDLSLFSVKGIVIAFITINFLIISYNMGKKLISYIEEQNIIQEDKTSRWSPIELFDLPSFEENIAGYDQIVSDLRYNARSYSKGRGIILYGPPGTGKTLLAKCYARDSKFSYMFCATGEDLQVSAVSNITGISSSKGKIIEFLDWVLEKSKGKSSLVFIDEIDKMGSKIAGFNGLSSGGIEFLNIIDGIYDKKYKNVFFIMTTNYIEWFNEACLRSGRLEHQYNVNYPNLESSYKIINFYFNYFESNSGKFNIKISENLLLNKLKIINFIYYSISNDIYNKDEYKYIKEIWKTVKFLRSKEKFNEEMIVKITDGKIDIFGLKFEGIGKDCEFETPNFEINRYREDSEFSEGLSKFTGSDIKSLMLSFLERFIYWEEKIETNSKFHLVWKLEFFNILEKSKKSFSSKKKLGQIIGNFL